MSSLEYTFNYFILETKENTFYILKYSFEKQLKLFKQFKYSFYTK